MSRLFRARILIPIIFRNEINIVKYETVKVCYLPSLFEGGIHQPTLVERAVAVLK